ncbi:hypothetical protein CS379_04500 [Methylobacterium frigidaeris]|nr:hypothetical protein CS379_04500 [Methylobacterium frigidaeris]
MVQADDGDVMRITLERLSTGAAFFPGLAKPVVVDSKALSPAAAMELEKLVEAAKIFDGPDADPSAAGRPSARGAADYEQKIVTVERGDDVRTVHLSDLASKSADIQALLNFVEKNSKR